MSSFSCDKFDKFLELSRPLQWKSLLNNLYVQWLVFCLPVDFVIYFLKTQNIIYILLINLPICVIYIM